jgi:O-antigen/teichoic acid export membrane protein
MLLAILTAGLIAMQTPLAQMLAAADMMWLSLLLNGVWATLYVVGARVLIAGGAFGLAEARAVAYLGYSALLVLAAWRIYIAMPRSRALPGE